MKQFSIRQYVAWLMFVPLFIMAASLESYFLHDRFSDMDNDMLERGELIAHQLASSSEYGVFSNNLEFLQNIANGALQQADVRGVVIFNSDAKVLVSAGQLSSAFKNEIIDQNITKTRLLLVPTSVSGHHFLHKPVRPAKFRSLIVHLLEDEIPQN